MPRKMSQIPEVERVVGKRKRMEPTEKCCFIRWIQQPSEGNQECSENKISRPFGGRKARVYTPNGRERLN